MLTAAQTSEYAALTDKAIQSCKNWLKEGKNQGKKKRIREKEKTNHLEH